MRNQHAHTELIPTCVVWYLVCTSPLRFTRLFLLHLFRLQRSRIGLLLTGEHKVFNPSHVPVPIESIFFLRSLLRLSGSVESFEIEWICRCVGPISFFFLDNFLRSHQKASRLFVSIHSLYTTTAVSRVPYP